MLKTEAEVLQAKETRDRLQVVRAVEQYLLCMCSDLYTDSHASYSHVLHLLSCMGFTLTFHLLCPPHSLTPFVIQANKVSLFIGSVVFSSTPPDNSAHTMVRVCRLTKYYRTILSPHHAPSLLFLLTTAFLLFLLFLSS